MPSLSEVHFTLPDELIAQRPTERREGSRLMVVDRAAGRIEHRHFHELPALLHANDLLVVNDTRVVPARVWTKRATGGRVQLLFSGPPRSAPGFAWLAPCLTRASKPLRPGTELAIDGATTTVRIVEAPVGGEAVVGAPEGGPSFFEFLAAHGEVPLPPYIRRDGTGPDAEDAVRYQTVYARDPGAVAAPTAGLHFTDEVLEALVAKGVRRAAVTLHVGPGTFQPVREDDYSRHTISPERYAIPGDTAAAVARHRPPQGRVVAVGTTTVRTLEWVAREDGVVRAGAGETGLFVTPGFRFRVVDALITNFHLPGSTLLLLVAAFGGRELVLEAYRQAVAERYRFYSYGDAMLLV